MNRIGTDVCVLVGLSLMVSVVLTFLVRKFALSQGLIDVPNERSSHRNPTPRAGGIAIALTATAAFCVLLALRRLEFAVFAALAGGVLVAAVGFLDDRYRLAAVVRLAAHALAALWALAWLGGLPPMRFGGHMVVFGAGGLVLAALGIVWVLNLFNFMDGIDGIAASEGAFVAWSAALLAPAVSRASGVTAAALILGAACLGFLRWNWPPARIFMGDVGSGYIGYVIAVLALAASRADPIALPVWLTLGGAFFADATVTLVRRAMRGERLHEAHRTHAYQWLSRRWGSHRRVTVTVLAVNLAWLFPCAWLETAFPQYAVLLAVMALAVLAAAVLAGGAGRSEREHAVLDN